MLATGRMRSVANPGNGGESSRAFRDTSVEDGTSVLGNAIAIAREHHDERIP